MMTMKIKIKSLPKKDNNLQKSIRLRIHHNLQSNPNNSLKLWMILNPTTKNHPHLLEPHKLSNNSFLVHSIRSLNKFGIRWKLREI